MARRIPPPDPDAERALNNLRLSFVPQGPPTPAMFEHSAIDSRDAVLAMTLGTPEAWIVVSRTMTRWMEYWGHPPSRCWGASADRQGAR